MQRVFGAIFFIIIIIGLSACGGNTDNKKESNGKVVDATVNTEEPTETDTQPEEVDEPTETDARPVESDEPLEGFDVHFIDSGINDNILIRSAETTIVVSANVPGWFDINNSLVPYLESQLVGDIDLLISTTSDSEWHPFIADTLENFTVKEFWSPNYNNNSSVGDRVQDALDKQGISQYTPLVGGKTTIGDIDLEVINSPESGEDALYDTLIFKVVYGDVSYLITGHVKEPDFKKTLDSDADLQATILKVPSTENIDVGELLEAANPRVVTILSGKSSAHPEPYLIDALDEAGIDEYGTLGHGNIVISTDGESYYIETEKEPEVVDPYNRLDGEKKRSLKSIK